MRKSVLFPHPLGPRSETKLPRSISNETPSSAWTDPRRLAYVLLTSRIAMVIELGAPGGCARESVEAMGEVTGSGRWDESLAVLLAQADVFEVLFSHLGKPRRFLLGSRDGYVEEDPRFITDRLGPGVNALAEEDRVRIAQLD